MSEKSTTTSTSISREGAGQPVTFKPKQPSWMIGLQQMATAPRCHARTRSRDVVPIRSRAG